MRRNWFSNFLPFDEPLLHEGLSYATPEHYYQALKCGDRDYRVKISQAATPADAKRLGRQSFMILNWNEVKYYIMEKAVHYKFQPGTTWHDKLKATGNAPIIEHNNWHDNYWGDCGCLQCKNILGQNNTGNILMSYRAQFI